MSMSDMSSSADLANAMLDETIGGREFYSSDNINLFIAGMIDEIEGGIDLDEYGEGDEDDEISQKEDDKASQNNANQNDSDDECEFIVTEIIKKPKEILQEDIEDDSNNENEDKNPKEMLEEDMKGDFNEEEKSDSDNEDEDKKPEEAFEEDVKSDSDNEDEDKKPEEAFKEELKSDFDNEDKDKKPNEVLEEDLEDDFDNEDEDKKPKEISKEDINEDEKIGSKQYAGDLDFEELSPYVISTSEMKSGSASNEAKCAKDIQNYLSDFASKIEL